MALDATNAYLWKNEIIREMHATAQRSADPDAPWEPGQPRSAIVCASLPCEPHKAGSSRSTVSPELGLGLGLESGLGVRRHGST